MTLFSQHTRKGLKKCNIDSDPLYNTWSKLTKAVCDTPTVTTTGSASW